jgi:hypothetical protein
MSVSRPTTPTVVERPMTTEDSGSRASNRSRVSSVLDMMMDRIDHQFAGVQSRVGEVTSHVGEISSRFGVMQSQVEEVNFQVGAMQSQVGEVNYQVGAIQSQVGEVMSRLDKLETSPTLQLAVGPMNPDCSSSAVVCRSQTAPFHSSHSLGVPCNADTSGLRRSQRLSTRQRVNYREGDNRRDRSQEGERTWNSIGEYASAPGIDPKALQRGDSPLRTEAQVAFRSKRDFATIDCRLT